MFIAKFKYNLLVPVLHNIVNKCTLYRQVDITNVVNKSFLENVFLYTFVLVDLLRKIHM